MTTRRGITRTGSILDRIVADKREALEAAKRGTPEAALGDFAAEHDAHWGMTQAISTPRGAAPTGAAVQIVAEIKKASPSRGVLAETLDPEAIAGAYTRGGAAAISVVTERNHFLGDLEWLRRVRNRLAEDHPGTRPSLLRKDFLVDPYELLEAKAYGADNILLIVAILDDTLLGDMLARARELELDALAEVHNEAEAARAVKAGATLFGINNRDLHTFNVDLGTTERVRPLLPADAIVIGESGVHTKVDVERLHRAGVRAILVGEAFMTAPDVAAKMAELRL
ncbi:MAG TPA: indole-3-glycerol phosphate synthase TrpC [Dehalococcoidia bacterium]|nr:indole-3-glycerol phosphate synthase TrpC [Dehalococcoidia bacterium]